MNAAPELKVYTFIRNTYNKKYEDRSISVEHYHDYYQLVFAQKGDGAAVINGEELPLKENDVILIPPNGKHFFKAYSEKFKTYELKFCYLSGSAEPLFSEVLSAKDTSGAIKKALRSVEAEADLSDAFSYNIILLELSKILELLKRAAAKEFERDIRLSSDFEETQDAFFAKIKAYIDKNIASDISVLDISREFHIEYKYFSRLFSKRYGIRLKLYINKIRLEKAKDMIINTDLSLSEIAIKCGFGSLHRMDRVFKTEENISPSVYRYRFKHSYAVDFNIAPKNHYN